MALGAASSFSSSVAEYDNYANGKKYRKAVFITRTDPLFTSLRDLWYPEGVKLVPRSLELTPLSIAIWFFDDGSNNVAKRQCRFHSNAFRKDDCEHLSSLLEAYQIKSRVNGKCVIEVAAESYKALVDIVRPYVIWDFFQKKVSYRDSAAPPPTTQEEKDRIVALYAIGLKQREIAERVGKSLSLVSRVLRDGRDGVALNNRSGHKGVSWDSRRGKWLASVKINGKMKNLGRYQTKEGAVEAIYQAQLETKRRD